MGRICLVGLLITCLSVSCTSGGLPENPVESFSETETVPVTQGLSESPSPEATEPDPEEPDTEGPVISGVQTLTAVVGGTLSYRDGVTAVDDRDGPVPFQVDSSQVDLSVPGEYDVIYSAEDSSGNRTEVTAVVVVMEPEPTVTDPPQPTKTPTQADVDALADKVLAKIINDGMTLTEKARAIFDYVYKNIKYVGYSDKSSWIVGAYDGFTAGRGDCFNYFACSKALLTRAGIPNVDVKREGGPTRHYWNLVDVGSGYYHFDACPHDNAYRIDSFMLTDAEVEEYTSWRGKNYYVYDHESCPVTVATTPFRGTAWHKPWTPPVEPEPEDPTVPEPEDPTVPEPEDPTVPEPEDPTVPEPEDPTVPEPEDPTVPEPEDPTQPDPEDPTVPEPEDPAQPEPEDPIQPDPENPTQPEPGPEPDGQEG